MFPAKHGKLSIPDMFIKIQPFGMQHFTILPVIQTTVILTTISNKLLYIVLHSIHITVISVQAANN